MRLPLTVGRANQQVWLRVFDMVRHGGSGDCGCGCGVAIEVHMLLLYEAG